MANTTGKKWGGRQKGTGNRSGQAQRIEERCKDAGLDVERFFILTAMGKMTCGKCLGSKRMPGIGTRGGELKKGKLCDKCAGTGHEILDPGQRVDAAGELFARIAPKLKSVELGIGIGGKKGTVSLAEALAKLSGVR